MVSEDSTRIRFKVANFRNFSFSIKINLDKTFITIIIIIIRVFCPRAGPSLQAQEPKLQFAEGRSSTAYSGTKAGVLPARDK